MKVHVNPDDLIQGNTDDRGRIYLGPEHANANVTVAILDKHPDEAPRTCENNPPCEGTPLPEDDYCPTCQQEASDD